MDGVGVRGGADLVGPVGGALRRPARTSKRGRRSVIDQAIGGMMVSNPGASVYWSDSGENVGQLRHMETSVVTVRLRDDGVTVARLPDVVDFDTVTALRAGILALLDESDCRHLVLDLSRVDSFDSSGLSMLLKVWHRGQATGTALTLAAPPPFISGMLHLTQASTVLAVSPSVEQALSTHHRTPGDDDQNLANQV
ncbi:MULTISPECIES: STAS domain-containing protein [unclassified Streptomyces]|uniref:STAS domain-containing protein n=1 Tax=unclassified Streptomyces TaxID=2593676 RepID=UPI0038175429